MQLNYDFSQTTETAASYIVFDQEMFRLGSNVTTIAVDVYGLENGEWLRMELVDESGEIHRYTFSDAIDHMGWKQLKVTFDEPLDGTMKLWRIYVVDNSGEIRYPGSKSILLKDLTIMAKSSLGAVTLQIDSPYMNTANGQMKMDVAPFIVAGRTMVPMRFIGEAFGGVVEWNAETQRVTTICNGHEVMLTIGEQKLIVDGKEKTLDVPAMIVDGRTMIPLRAVNEALGMRVEYIADIQMIIIEN